MAFSLAWLLAAYAPVSAWGPEGHAIAARIAVREMSARTRARVEDLLAADRDPLTAHDIASAASWADVWRDAGGDLDASGRHRTAPWHYLNLELRRPDFSWACWRRQPLPAGVPAAQGPWHDCIVDKIEQFETELAAPGTAASERLLALKFLLHLVADLHQPLHAADDHDHGGNDLRVRLPDGTVESLHRAWDSAFVQALGHDPQVVAQALQQSITDTQRRAWRRGTPEDWAWESWRIAKAQAYGRLPPCAPGVCRLDARYVENARRVVAQQLQKSGVRLAWLLDRALGDER
ncbi:MAG: S1/P1 nuclease [Sinobacteraceae bacterium]|nr:S1/P1 nuclease [Nevskiaceae bacterium]